MIAVGTVCLRASTYKPDVERRLQELQVRRLTADGRKAIVHHVVCPSGMVEAVEVDDLIAFDAASGFWIPKRCRAGHHDTPGDAKRARLVE